MYVSPLAFPYQVIPLAMAPTDGAGLLAAINTSCAEWHALDGAERVRRLVLRFWTPSMVWSQSYQQSLQSMITAIERYCSVVMPAGQILSFGYPSLGGIVSRPGFIAGYLPGAPGYTVGAPGMLTTSVPGTIGARYPLTLTYWLGRTGYSCVAWNALSYAAKVGAITSAASSVGQMLTDSSVAAIVSDIDQYCAGTSISASFLSPYVYPYSIYGYGYPLSYAFPWIVRSSIFRIPFGTFRAPMPRGTGGFAPNPNPGPRAK